MTLCGVLDPAWATDQGGGGKGANEHYALQGVEEMAWAYRRGPAWNDVGPGLLFMWATTLAVCTNGRSAPHQLALALDFRICASWVWWKCDEVKCPVCLGAGRRDPRYPCDGACDNGFVGFDHPARNGMGQYQETEHEFLFLCRRGDFDLEQYDAIRKVRDRSVICAPRGEHSEKPDKAYTQTIEPVLRAAFPDMRPVEFNCRKRRKGWDAVGRLHGEFLEDGKTPAPIVYERGED